MKCQILCKTCEAEYRKMFPNPSPYPGEYIKFVNGKALFNMRCDECNEDILMTEEICAMTIWAENGGIPYREWEGQYLDSVKPPHILKGIAASRMVFLDDIKLDPRESQRCHNHSPDGFNWGYGGSGPAQLALAIMLRLTGKPSGYQNLKWRVIAGIPQGKDFEIQFSI